MKNEIAIKRTDPRYINLDEDIFDALDPYEYRVYSALRFESDYSKEESIVKRSIKFIIEKSKVSRRHVFRCLNSLETIHFLIQRDISKQGLQNTYNISSKLNRFKPKETSASQAPLSNQCLTGTGVVPHRHGGSASQALHITNLSLLDPNTHPMCEPTAFFDIWNKFAKSTGMTPVNLESKKQVEDSSSAINSLLTFWPLVNAAAPYQLKEKLIITPEYFGDVLQCAFECGFFMLTAKQGHSLKTILKQSNFEKLILKIRSTLVDPN